MPSRKYNKLENEILKRFEVTEIEYIPQEERADSEKMLKFFSRYHKNHILQYILMSNVKIGHKILHYEDKLESGVWHITLVEIIHWTGKWSDEKDVSLRIEIDLDDYGWEK